VTALTRVLVSQKPPEQRNRNPGIVNLVVDGAVHPLNGRVPVKPGAKDVDPSRLFVVLRAMEKFREHSDGELAFITGLLSGKQPHLVRDTAADVLGGIKHRAGVTA
jgi:hypothetical protein